MKPRRQCAKCPWKVSTNPHDIPWYDVRAHVDLAKTIAEPGDLRPSCGGMEVMTCHETTDKKPLHCVGWLANQLGPGNNLALRLRAIIGDIDANVQTVGPQHQRFEDTLPRSARKLGVR